MDRWQAGEKVEDAVDEMGLSDLYLTDKERARRQRMRDKWQMFREQRASEGKIGTGGKYEADEE